jgi:hypothetical protein
MLWAVPYGIYEPLRNQGTVDVDQSADTLLFAVDVMARRWQRLGCPYYLSADLGRRWRLERLPRPALQQQIQAQLCDRYGLSVTVCHYPTGCSKWNPVEHRLFGPISLNWADQPLRDWETVLAYMRGTKTTTGLAVQAFLHEGVYNTGGSVSDVQMETLNLEHHAVCPHWNYTLAPRSDDHALAQTNLAER